jgi:hypothetical protein
MNVVLFYRKKERERERDKESKRKRTRERKRTSWKSGEGIAKQAKQTKQTSAKEKAGLVSTWCMISTLR